MHKRKTWSEGQQRVNREKMREADYACNKNRSQFLFLHFELSTAHVLARRLTSEKLDPHPELCPALSGYSLPVDAITGITPL